MSENWLQNYLAESVRRKLCTTIHCTTCGAQEFRLGVLSALANVSGEQPKSRYDRGSAIKIAMTLTDIQTDVTQSITLTDAVRCLLFDLCGGVYDAEIGQILDGSWAGKLLRDMEEHSRARYEEHLARKEYEDPVNVQKRRDEKKRFKQQKHQERLALKKERDRIWREKQQKNDPNINEGPV